MPQTSIAMRVPFHDVDSTGRIHFTAMEDLWRYTVTALRVPYENFAYLVSVSHGKN